MSHRKWTAALALVVPLACARAEPERPPNVLLISIDTLRADALGAYGAARPTSPTFDAFAAEAIVFERAISPSGVTAPAHMSILTGLAPTVHRVGNANFFLDAVGVDSTRIARFRLDPGVPTLASLLRDAGWRTAAFVGGGNLNAETGFDRGFETFDASPDNGLNGNRERLFDPARALAWIEAHRDQPFFAFLHTYVPHSPYLPPPPWDRAFDPDYDGAIPTDREAFYAEPGRNYVERFKRYWGPVDRESARDLEHLRAAYAGDVRYADDALRAILEGLERNGLDERTIVVVLSDHGEEFLEHGEFEHLGALYVEHVHVPLALRVPGRAPARVAAQVSTLDVLPTLLDLVGVEPPRALQGASLTRFLDAGGAREPAAGADPAISEMVFAWSVAGPAPAPDRALYALRTDSWTYLWTNRDGRAREELYERRADPGESRDLASDPAHAGTLSRLREAMGRHRERCRTLAAGLGGADSVELAGETVDELKALGYVK